jgi:NitT/TauT family transport system substrate-binding protein
MNRKTNSSTRRDFLKNTGRSLALAALAGMSPAALPLSIRQAAARVPVIKFAYILSDHHAPLMVAANNPGLFQRKYSMSLEPVTEGKVYDFRYKDQKVARIQLIPTKKGPDVQKLIARGGVDMAISGTQAILMSVDRGVDTRIVSPLQTEGNVFVLKKGLEIGKWNDFIKHVKGHGKQFPIGIPGPHTVAAIIFRSALDQEGVSCTENAADKSADILFVNMKGHGNLVTALSNDITRGIIGAEPYPAVTIDRGIGRLITNLADVPPGQRWEDHACCSIEAGGKFIRHSPRLYAKMMELMAVSILETRDNPSLTVAACASWLGVSPDVEEIAMESLHYTFNPTPGWKESVYTYSQTMDQTGLFSGALRGADRGAMETAAFDFKGLTAARSRLAARGIALPSGPDRAR